MRRIRFPFVRPWLPTLLLAMTLVVAGCGSDDNDDSTVAAKANGIDLAFVDEMIPHHQSAIEMARIATTRGEHTEVKQLAKDIISAQTSEIMQLRALRRQMAAGGIARDDLGMSEKEMGMSTDGTSLRTADPFDKAFIDMMTAHHEGATAMAKIELGNGGDLETRKIAESIISAQHKEIADMAAWRKRWYGSSGGSDHGHSMNTG